jgi:hypothetical protein
MADVLKLIFRLIVDLFRSRAAQEAEIVVLVSRSLFCGGVDQTGCRPSSWNFAQRLDFE